jgi:drug/metabolite transporter (DMT)-like permease
MLLAALILLWGTSFMFTAISVRTVDPVTVVFYRLALGAVVLSLVVYARGDSLPLNWQAWTGFFVMAIAGNALPFFLIAWGQQSVDSGVAGMIMAIMPLLTMVFAHYLVEGETLNRYKLIGFTRGSDFHRGHLLRGQHHLDQAAAALQPDGRRLRGVDHGLADPVPGLAAGRPR